MHGTEVCYTSRRPHSRPTQGTGAAAHAGRTVVEVDAAERISDQQLGRLDHRRRHALRRQGRCTARRVDSDGPHAAAAWQRAEWPARAARRRGSAHHAPRGQPGCRGHRDNGEGRFVRSWWRVPLARLGRCRRSGLRMREAATEGSCSPRAARGGPRRRCDRPIHFSTDWLISAVRHQISEIFTVIRSTLEI